MWLIYFFCKLCTLKYYHFVPSRSYVSGGLYYTISDFIPLFLDYDTQIAEISLLVNAQFYEDPRR